MAVRSPFQRSLCQFPSQHGSSLPPPPASTDSLSVFLTSYSSCPPPTFRSAPPRPRALAPSTPALSSARLSFHLSFSSSFSRGWLYTRYRLSAVLRWLYRVSCLTTLIQFPRFPKCFLRSPRLPSRGDRLFDVLLCSFARERALLGGVLVPSDGSMIPRVAFFRLTLFFFFHFRPSTRVCRVFRCLIRAIRERIADFFPTLFFVSGGHCFRSEWDTSFDPSFPRDALLRWIRLWRNVRGFSDCSLFRRRVPVEIIAVVAWNSYSPISMVHSFLHRLIRLTYSLSRRSY